MPLPQRLSERDQLELFRPTSRNIPPRDAQDLMAYPFFSLAKSRRTRPIDFHAGDVSVEQSTPVPLAGDVAKSPAEWIATSPRDAIFVVHRP